MRRTLLRKITKPVCDCAFQRQNFHSSCSWFVFGKAFAEWPCIISYTHSCQRSGRSPALPYPLHELLCFSTLADGLIFNIIFLLYLALVGAFLMLKWAHFRCKKQVRQFHVPEANLAGGKCVSGFSSEKRYLRNFGHGQLFVFSWSLEEKMIIIILLVYCEW